jgi:DNA-binding NtrC family response regulator
MHYNTLMKNIILCSSNPILIKSLYSMLRDDGYNVETIEHPAQAVQMVMRRHYHCVIVDSEPFGLSAEDAATIIKAVSPLMPILFVGDNRVDTHAQAVHTAIDLEAFKLTIHSIAV